MAEGIENGKIQIYNKFNEWLCRRSLRGREAAKIFLTSSAKRKSFGAKKGRPPAESVQTVDARGKME